jgi:hypothetical protein
LPALLRLLRPVLFTMTIGRTAAATDTNLPTGARTVAPVTYSRGAPVLHGSGPVPARLSPAGSGARPPARMLPTPRRPLGAGGRTLRSPQLELPAVEIMTRTDRQARNAQPSPARRPPGEDPAP